MMSFEPGKLRTDGYDDVSGLNTFTSGNGAGKNGCCGNTGFNGIHVKFGNLVAVSHHGQLGTGHHAQVGSAAFNHDYIEIINHLGNPGLQIGRGKVGVLVGLELAQRIVVDNKLFRFRNNGIMLGLLTLLDNLQLLGFFFKSFDPVGNSLDAFHVLALGLEFCQSGLLGLQLGFLGFIGGGQFLVRGFQFILLLGQGIDVGRKAFIFDEELHVFGLFTRKFLP